MTAVRTTCAYCGVGCGIAATVTGPRSVEIAGDVDHPANAGKLCSKGTHLGETIGLEGRLLSPEINGRRVGWDKALDLVARRFRQTIARYGPDSVAFYVSGQLLTEDYYVANKLMKGFIGSANIDTNSRLCMASAVTAHIRAWGEDVVPASYADLDAADLIVLVGSNTAWCHPILYRRIMAARAARATRVVVIDPRRTETAEEADLHLAIRSGSDLALMTGLLAWCRESGAVDEDFLQRRVNVPADFWASLDGADLWSTARACDIPPAELKRFYELFAATPRTVTLFSQGINQSIRGTDQANAILNLHLATGRIGRPGAAPFSITGQPNAMGGREVGGMASTLAAHMGFTPENVGRVGRFWSAPNMADRPGLKAVDMFRAVGEGRIKALWVMGTNPAVSLPDAGRVREALRACPFVVVSDCIADTDTNRFAHVKLPAAAWGEKDGTVTNSERVISRQRAFLPRPGEARPDWWIIKEVARRMGWASEFSYDRPAAIFREHARLSTYENGGRRLLDLGRQIALSYSDYDAMKPWRWGGEAFADGVFPTPDGRANLVTSRVPPLAAPLARWPMILNTGRYRDQWHTMTRSGLSPKLARHREEPLVEIHPEDARALGLAERDLARVATPQGDSLFRVALNDGQLRGELFTPIHWTDVQATGGRAGMLPRPLTDPHSGQPGFKSTPARLDRQPVDWTGFMVLQASTGASRREPPKCLWATRIAVPRGELFELAGVGDPSAVEACLPPGARIEATDRVRGLCRIGILNEGRLVAALFVTGSGSLPPRDWLVDQLGQSAAPAEILAGRPAAPAPDRGPIVCACFDIGLKTVLAAVASQQLTDVEAIGAALSAGTNCGSCRPELRRIVASSRSGLANA